MTHDKFSGLREGIGGGNNGSLMSLTVWIFIFFTCECDMWYAPFLIQTYMWDVICTLCYAKLYVTCDMQPLSCKMTCQMW